MKRVIVPVLFGLLPFCFRVYGENDGPSRVEALFSMVKLHDAGFCRNLTLSELKWGASAGDSYEQPAAFHFEHDFSFAADSFIEFQNLDGSWKPFWAVPPLSLLRPLQAQQQSDCDKSEVESLMLPEIRQKPIESDKSSFSREFASFLVPEVLARDWTVVLGVFVSGSRVARLRFFFRNTESGSVHNINITLGAFKRDGNWEVEVVEFKVGLQTAKPDLYVNLPPEQCPEAFSFLSQSARI